MHGELLRIECHGTTRTARPHPDVVQHADGLRVAAEEVQPPSVWSIAHDPLEECAIALLQQAVSEMLAMAIHDEGLTCERT